jgi:putative FmdB family regulatory protein
MGAIVMPIFEYICQECQHEFETLVFGRDQAKCPKCHSQKLSPQLSVFAVSSKGMSSKGMSAKEAAPSASTGACGSCGDPRGPGACSLGDLD